MAMSNERRCSYCGTAVNPNDEVYAGLGLDKLAWYAHWLAGFCSPVCAEANAKSEIRDGKAWWQGRVEDEVRFELPSETGRVDEVRFELPSETSIEPGNYTVKVKAVRDDVNGPVVELVELKKEPT